MSKYWWFGKNSLWCKWFGKIFGCYKQPEPPEPEYVTVNVCQETRKVANPYCPSVEDEKFIKGEEPIEVCTFHKKPLEYVTILVCKRSGLRPLKYCLFTEMRKFIKGEEPKKNCDVHPVPKFKKKRRELRFGGWMGLDFLANAWDDDKYEETCERLLAVLLGFRKRGYSVNESFIWLGSGRAEHKHLNWKLPWMTRGVGAARKVMLNVFNPKYFRILKAFIRLHKLADVELESCLYMWGDYNNIPFRDNINGVRRFTSPEALPFQQAFGNKVCEAYEEVYGDDSKTRIKILNEGQHGGSTDAFHWLGEFHRDIAKELLEHISISKIKVDNSHSEGPQIWLNEPLPCGKCDEIHGDPRFDRANPNNSILAESHGNSILINILDVELFFPPGKDTSKTLEKGIGVLDPKRVEIFWGENHPLRRELVTDCKIVNGNAIKLGATWAEDIKANTGSMSVIVSPHKLNYLGSKWKRYELSGDGGAGQPTKGYRIPGTNFYQGNAEETYKLYKYAFQQAKTRGKQIVMSLWTFEIFIYKTSENNDWREFYGMTNILWDRVDAPVRAVEEVYGT